MDVKTVAERPTGAWRNSTWRYAILVAAIAVVYFGAGKLGLSLASASRNVTAVWPPSGLALAALLLLGPRVWPGVFIGAFLVNATVTESISPALGIASGNTLMGLAGWAFLHRIAAIDYTLERLRHVLALLVGAPLFAVVSATAGVATLAMHGEISWSAYPSLWSVWWVGDTLGILLLTPVALTWASRPLPRWSGRRIAELTALYLTLGALSAGLLADGLARTASVHQAIYLIILVVLWGALRFGQRVSTLAVLVTATIGVWGAAHGRGPFAGDFVGDERLVQLNLFLGVLIVTGLAVSALVVERERAEGALQRERAHARLRAVVDSSIDAVVTADSTGTITSWSPGAATMFGYADAAIIGQPSALLTPPRLRDELMRALASANRGEPAKHLSAVHETVGLRSDGTEFPAEASLATWHDGGRAYVGVVRDASRRKATEETLSQRTAQYDAQRNVALVLRRGLISALPEVAELETGSRGRPARNAANVGGDWLDVIRLGAGRVGVLVGDVMGSGLESAVTMGQLRSAAHALARTGMSPRQLMHALDGTVRELPGHFIVTGCYLIVDTVEGAASICSAGHLPTLLVAPGRATRRLSAPINVPLGVGHIPFEAVHLPIPLGGTLAMYTDGLVESRETDIDTRLGLLARELPAALTETESLDGAADRVLSVMIPHGAEGIDDVTLLLVRLPATPPSIAALDLPADASAPGLGRQFLTGTLSEWGCSAITETVKLLANELISNAVDHARGPFCLRTHRTATELTVEVTDHSSRPALARSVRPTDVRGRGLMLVDKLAHDWGSRPLDDGKVVWFTLRLDNPTVPS
jgi:PAS domain S-box-containing protein